MLNSEYFKNKKITIVGLARSGVACANLLHTLGAQVWVTEINDDPQTRQACGQLISSKIQVELGKHSLELIKQADLVVISPGVPPDSQCVIWAREANKLLISEIEVASILCPAKIIAVTGSNGKTTVTTLIGKILEADGKRARVCGNIGNPFSAEIPELKADDFVVLEVSSFQLETIKNFKPKIAVMLNLTANHFDRYRRGLQEYLTAKKRIFMNQDSGDFLVLNADDPVLTAVAPEAKAKVIYFAKADKLNLNQSAVTAVGSIMGISLEKMQKVFQEFKGLEHRLEEVVEINGIKFINDSKATTADSAIWAISNITAPIILIAGGRHKGIDYRVIAQAAKDKVKQAFLIGEARDIIAEDLQGVFPICKTESLEAAVGQAYAQARPGYCVLLSPMCSSYDMFSDYEARGRSFKKIVLDLAQKEKTHG